MIATIGYVIFEAVSIILFMFTDKKVKNSPNLKEWQDNYKTSCDKELDMTNAL
jgi:hypothetical protein